MISKYADVAQPLLWMTQSSKDQTLTSLRKNTMLIVNGSNQKCRSPHFGVFSFAYMVVSFSQFELYGWPWWWRMGDYKGCFSSFPYVWFSLLHYCPYRVPNWNCVFCMYQIGTSINHYILPLFVDLDFVLSLSHFIPTFAVGNAELCKTSWSVKLIIKTVRKVDKTIEILHGECPEYVETYCQYISVFTLQ